MSFCFPFFPCSSGRQVIQINVVTSGKHFSMPLVENIISVQAVVPQSQVLQNCYYFLVWVMKRRPGMSSNASLTYCFVNLEKKKKSQVFLLKVYGLYIILYTFRGGLCSLLLKPNETFS